MSETDSKREKLHGALFKCAVGYTAVDETEEFVIADGKTKPVKSKVSRREIGPDLAAIKLLLDDGKDADDALTEEELIKERDRLLGLLKEVVTGT